MSIEKQFELTEARVPDVLTAPPQRHFLEVYFCKWLGKNKPVPRPSPCRAGTGIRAGTRRGLWGRLWRLQLWSVRSILGHDGCSARHHVLVWRLCRSALRCAGKPSQPTAQHRWRQHSRFRHWNAVPLHYSSQSGSEVAGGFSGSVVQHRGHAAHADGSSADRSHCSGRLYYGRFARVSSVVVCAHARRGRQLLHGAARSHL